MTTTTIYASAGATVIGTGDAVWALPNNIAGAPDTFSASSTIAPPTSELSQHLRASFDLSAIPPQAVIDGFEVTLTCRDTLTETEIALVQLYDDATPLGADQSGAEALPIAFGELAYGGLADDFGYSTPDTAVVKGAQFNVRIQAAAIAALIGVAQIDAVQFAVTWTTENAIYAGTIDAGTILAGVVYAGEVLI